MGGDAYDAATMVSQKGDQFALFVYNKIGKEWLNANY